ncbi:MCE family protein [Mycobacterium sp. CVI_P3]|uniref:MCE family protein n=1 Tax=Mycobacterium pinniadriaticum TaxID=2994102 RepID=A0ABT3SMN2_9MYCO|nr:MCE family protein [Mycobacterium pinniadriaticum]MCX2934000.1 MCE family protein [Mycobacterium pinniadriaticum]MCX2940404.1 MCE family protein [Mycobacterium pinniadriaticum]
MKDNLAGAAWRFAIFTMVCLVGAFAVMAVFSQLRFQPETTYRAEFATVTGLKTGDLVRIAGVEVGKIKTISINKVVAVVEFSADDSVVLTQGTKAAIRWADPIGGRYLALEDGAGGAERLKAGQTIPVDRTEPALDLDTLLGGFRPLFRALDPDQVNQLSAQLIEAFQGQGATIGSFLNQAAALTNTFADRDDLIGEVIDNLNAVLGSLGDQSDQFAKGVDSLSQLVQGLAARRGDISNAVAYTNAATGTVADLMAQARPAFQNTVHQADRTAGIVVADHAYFDDLLNTLPDAYQTLTRLGIYGDYFTFYLCDLLLKVNGKGGQPVYIKLAEQPSGRCTAK